MGNLLSMGIKMQAQSFMCTTYEFTDNLGTGGTVFYVPCGSNTETSLYLFPNFSASICVTDGTTPYSNDGMTITNMGTACTI